MSHSFKFMKVRHITRGDGAPYLWRLYIFQTPWFGLMLHRFWQSDDDCLHDHPFPFISVILRGGYREWSFIGDDKIRTKCKWYGPGSIVCRRASWSHKLEVEEPGKTWTLVLRGPMVRRWGFWDKFGTWIHWKRYNHSLHCE